MTNYNEKVTEGRTLAKRSEDDQWRLAELTWRAVEEDGKTQVEWASDIGVDQRWVSTLYNVWTRYAVRRNELKFWDAVRAFKHDVDPADARQAERDKLAQRTVRNASPAQRAETARELLADPEVAEQIADDIVDHVASDPVRTAHVISKRRDTTPQPVHTDEPKPQRDYDAMVEQWVNLASVTFAAESSGTWKPNEHSEALLYFISQIIGQRTEPTGEKADFINGKLENLFSEVEAYANSETS